MIEPEEFEWDEAKAQSNHAKHRVPFEFAVQVFDDVSRVEISTIREEDGEDRHKVIGTIAARLYTVVFTMRIDVCRVISARRSNTKEERAYGNRST